VVALEAGCRRDVHPRGGSCLPDLLPRSCHGSARTIVAAVPRECPADVVAVWSHAATRRHLAARPTRPLSCGDGGAPRGIRTPTARSVRLVLYVQAVRLRAVCAASGRVANPARPPESCLVLAGGLPRGLPQQPARNRGLTESARSLRWVQCEAWGRGRIRRPCDRWWWRAGSYAGCRRGWLTAMHRVARPPRPGLTGVA
jgi:hypothetical protein